MSLAIERIAAALAMALLCGITLANVVVRYLTDYSFAFTEEVSVALMVVVALLGTGIAAARDRHIRVAWFVDRLRGRMRQIVEIAASLATFATFAVLVWLGGVLVWDEFRFEVTSPGIGAPQWLYTLALPVLSAAVAARVAGELWRRHRRKGEGKA